MLVLFSIFCNESKFVLNGISFLHCFTCANCKLLDYYCLLTMANCKNIFQMVLYIHYSKTAYYRYYDIFTVVICYLIKPCTMVT